MLMLPLSRMLIGSLALVAAVQNVVGVENVLPASAPAGRYATMREHCPFAVASPVAAPAPALPSFAANWYVSGIARVGETDFVSIKARDLSSQFSLFGREPDVKSGVTLVDIAWVEGIGKSVVTIQKGTEIAKLEFNESVVHGPAQGPVGQSMPPNGRGAAVAVVPPPAPGTRPVPVPNGFKGPAPGQVPARPPTASVGGQPMTWGAYQVPNGIQKPMTPFPRRPYTPANQAAR